MAPLTHQPEPLGRIEPHAGLLTLPPSGQLLTKIMKVEHLLASIEGSYLHFNRVDSYADFPDADPHDGQQLPADQVANNAARFARAPAFTAATYYDECRARTYACCFALGNPDHVWRNYANGGAHGKVGVVFDFQQMRAQINRHLAPEMARPLYKGIVCKQIFSVNYGVVTYVDWNRHTANEQHLPNPIAYTYLKAEQFRPEQELRVSLSAIGIGNFALNDGTFIEFPASLQAPFDFRTAIATGTVRQILMGPDCDGPFLQAELTKFGIEPAPGSDGGAADPVMKPPAP